MTLLILLFVIKLLARLNIKKFANSTQNRQKKRAKREKIRLPKESVENADSYKPIFNKIMKN